MNWMILAAGLFVAWQYGLFDKIKAALASKSGDKPLTAADVKTLLADHGLECKHKPPEVVQNADGSVTIKGLPPAK